MNYRWLIGLLLLFAARPALAQDVVLPAGPVETAVFQHLLPDSLLLLARYERAGQAAAVERLATVLLTRYPGRVGMAGPSITYYPGYPQLAYARRANARSVRGNFRGAEADLGQVLRYTARYSPSAGFGYYAYDGEQVSLLRDTYYTRALIRLDQLGNRTGGCADLGRAYQYDTLRAGHPHWRGCALPATRQPIAGNFARAQRAGLDSVSRLKSYLATGQPERAARLLAQLQAGRAGAFEGVPHKAWQRNDHPEDELPFLASRVARQLGSYGRARALLDSLLGLDPQPLYYYERGTLRLDQQHDPTGCDDLRWVYDHDSSRTGRAHPRWRGCPLPRYKVPIGVVETAAYARAYGDSVALANRLLQSQQPAPAVRLLIRLLTTGAASRYAPASRPRPTTQGPDAVPPANLQEAARDARARAYLALADYPHAVAELDTLIQYFDTQQRDYVCRRGAIRADFLPDSTGLAACRDLQTCRNRGLHPPGPNPWRNCVGQEPPPTYQYGQPIKFSHLFTEPTYPILRVGLFTQGAVFGVEAGCLLSSAEELEKNVFGPSLGLDLAGNSNDLIITPKLSYEYTSLVVGGRLDLGYNLNQHLTGDLRLTPQFGLTLGGLLNLYYGYAIPVAGTELEALGRHRLSLFINFLHVGKLGG